MVAKREDMLVGMKEICAFLTVSESTVLKWYRESGLQIKKVAGGTWIGSRKKIQTWLEKYLEEE